MKAKFVLLFTLVTLMGLQGIAQNQNHVWGVWAGAGKSCYNGDLGNGFFNFDTPFYLHGAVGLSRYLNPSFDAKLMGSFGNHGYWETEKPSFLTNMLNVTLEANYKFNNGYILPQSSKFAPFLSLGLGLANYNPIDDRGKKDTNFGIPLGLGIRYAFNDQIGIFWQSKLGLNFGDEFDKVEADDDNDNYMQHQIGVTFSFGKGILKDRDKDGIPDLEDACPGIKGPIANLGCPELPKTTVELFDRALQGIHFETEKAVIKPESFFILDDIAKTMEKNSYYFLMISGHTDSDGTDEFNMDLSNKRASAVKTYLMSKGVADDRMTTQGFGESRPIATNDTEEGKAINRRVEFKVTFIK